MIRRLKTPLAVTLVALSGGKTLDQMVAAVIEVGDSYYLIETEMCVAKFESLSGACVEEGSLLSMWRIRREDRRRLVHVLRQKTLFL